MEERMRSRLGWGLVADLHPTTYELRLGILQAQADAARMQIPGKVLEFLAHKIPSNVRELEGALNRICAHAQLVGRAITIESAQEVLHDLLRANDRRVTIDEIQKRVAEHYIIRLADMHSARRARAVARPRQVAMYLCKQLTPRSVPEHGRKFGGRDHTKVMHAVRKIEELRTADRTLAEDVELLRRMLETGGRACRWPCRSAAVPRRARREIDGEARAGGLKIRHALDAERDRQRQDERGAQQNKHVGGADDGSLVADRAADRRHRLAPCLHRVEAVGDEVSNPISGGAGSSRCEPDRSDLLRQEGHGCFRAGMPAPWGRRLTLLALPVGPAAGVIYGIGPLVLSAAGADQVALAIHRGRARRQPAHVALRHRCQLRRARRAEGVVLADLEGVD